MKMRQPEFPVHEIFINRTSSRVVSSEPLDETIIMSLFEAARWAPSSFNNQPWRFLYALQGSSSFNHLIKNMAQANASWAQHAPIVILVISSNNFTYNGEYSPSHSFDAGAACQNMALQAMLHGLTFRIIEGFDKDMTRTMMNIPEHYTIEVMIIVGKPGDKEKSSLEKISQRKSLKEIVFKDTFEHL